jgi:UDP-N-acetylmuramate dehydrogenase
MIEQNISLKTYNTFGVDVLARYFSTFNDVEDLLAILQSANWGRAVEQPLLVLGCGSNVLFTKNFDGIVLKNEIHGIELIDEDQDHFYVRVGAGENWHQFVLYCLRLICAKRDCIRLR